MNYFRTMYVTSNSYQHRSICVCNIDPDMNQITESSLVLKWIGTLNAHFDLQKRRSHRTKFNSSLYIVNTPEYSCCWTKYISMLTSKSSDQLILLNSSLSQNVISCSMLSCLLCKPVPYLGAFMLIIHRHRSAGTGRHYNLTKVRRTHL